MKRPIARHDWFLSACRVDAGLRDDAAAARLLVDAHRNRRGPFTAAGGVVRALIDDAGKHAPELVATHLVTLLLVAPEIAGRIEVPADVRDASAVSREGNPTSWTRRVANGVADFILGCLERRRAFPAGFDFYECGSRRSRRPGIHRHAVAPRRSQDLAALHLHRIRLPDADARQRAGAIRKAAAAAPTRAKTVPR